MIRGVSVILHNEAISSRTPPLARSPTPLLGTQFPTQLAPSAVLHFKPRVKSLLQSGERGSFSLPSMLLTTTACRRRSSGLAMKRSIMAEAPNAAAKQHTARHHRRAAAAAAIAKETRPVLTDHACSACRAKTEPRHTM